MPTMETAISAPAAIGSDGQDQQPGSQLPVAGSTQPPEVDDNDVALLQRWAAEVEVPQWLRDRFRQMVTDRDYVRRDCMLNDTQDTVAVNHILRNQTLTLAYLGVADPQPFCQPARRVGNQVAQVVESFADTMEIHLSQQAMLMRFGEKLEGLAQDASTNGNAILKVTLQSDFMKDATGEARFGDQQEAVAEYLRLKEAERLGELREGTADYATMCDLETTLRVFVAGKIEEQIKSVPQLVPGLVPQMNPMTGEPVVNPETLEPVMVAGLVPDPQDPRELQRTAILEGKELDILGLPVLQHYLGFNCDQILPEDFRMDWRVTRPEDVLNAEWMAHRCFMRQDEIARKWGVPTKEIQAYTLAQTTTGRLSTARDTSLDPVQRMSPEVSTVNDEIAVWELYHRPTLHRYVFIPGMKRFLEKEVWQACGQRFFPFFELSFNRVTGNRIPPSDVQLVRKLQDEYNTLRSHDREARRGAYPCLLVPKGWLDDTAKELYRNRYPFSIIECDRAEEALAAMKETVTVPYDPRLFDTSRVAGDMAEMFNLPRAVTGQTDGSDLASSVALAKEGMETGVARRKVLINRLITDVFKWMAEISLKVFPESVIKKRCGDLAVWPRLTVEELYTTIHIEVQGGLTGRPRSKDQQDFWLNFANIAKNLGTPVNGVEVLKQLMEAENIRRDPTRFISPLPAFGAPPPGPGMPGPTQGGGATPEGGAPPMASPQRGAPDSLSKIPNHPASVPTSPKS